MIPKNQIKHINSLRQKKYREINREFVAEGVKIVGELLKSSMRIKCIYAVKGWIESSGLKVQSSKINSEVIEISEEDLKRISYLETPNEVLAIAEIPQSNAVPAVYREEIMLMLDSISDPGNMGTIIRTADWFGIKHLVCSDNCVDVFNPKVVQATMGSVARIEIYYTNPDEFLSRIDSGTYVYGAMLEGESIYESRLCDKGIIIIGNESQGISNEIRKHVNHPVSIPPYTAAGLCENKADSLNVAIATGIICSEFRRKYINAGG